MTILVQNFEGYNFAVFMDNLFSMKVKSAKKFKIIIIRIKYKLG